MKKLRIILFLFIPLILLSGCTLLDIGTAVEGAAILSNLTKKNIKHVKLDIEGYDHKLIIYKDIEMQKDIHQIIIYQRKRFLGFDQLGTYIDIVKFNVDGKIVTLKNPDKNDFEYQKPGLDGETYMGSSYLVDRKVIEELSQGDGDLVYQIIYANGKEDDGEISASLFDSSARKQIKKYLEDCDKEIVSVQSEIKVDQNSNKSVVSQSSNESTTNQAETSETASANNITGTVTDIEGNVYHTVKIGNQVWTVENLRTTKYNDGTQIPLITDNAAWKNLRTPGYCYYNNMTNADSIKKYGALYNWYAIDTKKLAPQGWHVPTDEEWTILENYLIVNSYNWDGTTTRNKVAKSMAAKTDWKTAGGAGTIGNNLTKNNRSGFAALPGGGHGYDGVFGAIGNYGIWWSAAEFDASYAYYRNLGYDRDYLGRYNGGKSCGFSVRLVEDEYSK